MEIDGYVKGIKVEDEAVNVLKSEGVSNANSGANSHPNNAD